MITDPDQEYSSTRPEWERCSLCGRQIPLDQRESWVSESNESILLPTSSKVVACARTSAGEVDICEDCYIARTQFDEFSRADLREIHEQFGLEYQQRKYWHLSLEAFGRAASIREDANLLFSMGVTYKGMGDTKRALDCYRRALELDPHHAFARDNLALLDDSESDSFVEP